MVILCCLLLRCSYPSNDSFVGLDNWTISTEAGSYPLFLNAYVAGTDVKLKDSGEGFNATRADTDYVAIHLGVVTGDDGLVFC